jgi:predicted DNA-binding transcriptional regulator YafY
MTSAISYFELHTPDPSRAQAFYGELFNWKFKELAIPGQQYFEVLSGGELPGGMMRIDGRSNVARTNLFAPALAGRPGLPALGRLRAAIRDGRRVRFRYVDEAGRETVRQVRPLALAFWGRVWSMAAWCELREDFRSFRVDRVTELDLTAPFHPEPGRTLDDFIRHAVRQTAARP